MRMSDETLPGNMATPKEQLTAFQRWELDSFDPIPNLASMELSPIETIAAAKLAETQLQLAQQQAYDAGHQAGYAAGIKLAQTETARLQDLIENLQLALSQVDEQLAQSLIDLSLEIARKMLGEALKVNPEIIVKVASSAIACLPHFNQNAHLILNPGDTVLVQKLMGEQLAHAQWKVFSDAGIEPGGCRVETAHSQIDATNPARWQSIVESIGQHKSWLTT